MAGRSRTTSGTVRVQNDYSSITAFAQQQVAIALSRSDVAQQQVMVAFQQQVTMAHCQQMALAYQQQMLMACQQQVPNKNAMAGLIDDNDEAMPMQLDDDTAADAAADDTADNDERPPNCGKRHHMLLNLMKEGSDHSHRMHKKNKPKHYLPRKDVRHAEEMLMFKCDTPCWYNATDLGTNPHCSVPDAMVDEVIEDYKTNGIPHTAVDYSSQGADGNEKMAEWC